MTEVHANMSRAVGWRRPSWAGLLLIAKLGSALGLLRVTWLLAYFAVFAGFWGPILAAGLAGLWYSATKQQAIEGALSVSVALALGHVAGAIPAIFQQTSGDRDLSDLWFPTGLVFFLALAVAPVIVAKSQRRAMPT